LQAVLKEPTKTSYLAENDGDSRDGEGITSTNEVMFS